MLFILSFTVFSVIFGQLFKLASNRGCHTVSITTCNYCVAGLLLGVCWVWLGNATFSRALVLVGTFGGVSFMASAMALVHSLSFAEVGLTMTAFRLSLVVPILMAIIFWDERPSGVQTGGIVFVLLALLLLGRTGHRGRRLNDNSGVMVLAVFLCEGMAKTSMRMVHEYRLDNQIVGVLVIVFITAFALGAALLVRQRRFPSAHEVTLGVCIGIANILATGSILLALRDLPGYLVFSVGHMLCVALDNVCAWIIWQENLTVRKVAGIILGVSAAGLVSLQ